MDDLTKIDLYELLQIELTATEKEIKKAYRKKALCCHPDKNPDDPKAAENFQRLSKALEILTDGAAKAAYDRVLKSRKERVVRHRELDAKRKKLKEDLEERERNAKDEVISEADAAKKLQEHIERLRKEGSKHLEEERLLLKKQIEEEAQLAKMKLLEEANKPRLKFMWKSSKKDPENGGYNNSNLMDIFQKYGEVTCVVLGKKGGTCLVEYQSVESAVEAYNLEKGLTENPLTSTWLQGQPTPKTEEKFEKANRPTFPQINIENQCGFQFRDGDSGTITERDYESVVLTKMRQAQERKRLIEEMEKDDVQ